ncbi:MAG: uroporphyrinogen decarboxylase family protein [Candidatus Methylarchaceae archaeon HK02M2]|nr:uroporphyrinogen decarboxylase family protein [Candidatus Methylarchaceae archaeon HK02M2]
MNSLERFEVTLNLEKPERVPLFYLYLGAGHSVLNELGVTMRDVYYSAQGIAKTQMKAREMFGHDNVMSPWGCITVEAEALGSKIEKKEMDYPKIVEYILKDSEEVDKLEVPDPLKDGRMPMILESLNILVDTVGKDTTVVGFMSSPFTILDGIRGFDKILKDILINPDLLKKMLKITTHTCIEYGRSMIDQGVNVILIKDGFAGGDLMSKTQCLEFDIRYLRSVVTSLKNYGASVIIGNVSSKPYLDLQVDLNPDAICFATGDVGKVKKKFGNKVCIIGNVDQTKMPFKRAIDIEKEAKSCIEKAKEGGGYILSTGCEIPLETPADNVRVLRKSVEKYGAY